jgi:hypothetical protein
MAELTDAGPDRPRNTGAGRVLFAGYCVFALSATARATYQIATQFDQAPLAYLLSAAAGLVYLTAAVALGRSGPTAWRVAVTACTVEFVGVFAIGLWTTLQPDLFEDETVWSGFGRGYGYVPLVLPPLGLAWLLRHRPRG